MKNYTRGCGWIVKGVFCEKTRLCSSCLEKVNLQKENQDLKNFITEIYDKLDGSHYTPDLQSDIRDKFYKLVPEANINIEEGRS